MLTITELRLRATVTVEEAGALLGLSRGSAYAAAHAGDLPVIRVGRRFIVSAPALLRMLDGQADGSPSTTGRDGA